MLLEQASRDLLAGRLAAAGVVHHDDGQVVFGPYGHPREERPDRAVVPLGGFAANRSVDPAHGVVIEYGLVQCPESSRFDERLLVPQAAQMHAGETRQVLDRAVHIAARG